MSRLHLQCRALAAGSRVYVICRTAEEILGFVNGRIGSAVCQMVGRHEQSGRLRAGDVFGGMIAHHRRVNTVIGPIWNVYSLTGLYENKALAGLLHTRPSDWSGIILMMGNVDSQAWGTDPQPEEAVAESVPESAVPAELMAAM